MEVMRSWLKAATVRAVKTAAQAALGVIGASAIMGDVMWPMVGSAALLAVDGGASVAKIVKEEGNE